MREAVYVIFYIYYYESTSQSFKTQTYSDTRYVIRDTHLIDQRCITIYKIRYETTRHYLQVKICMYTLHFVTESCLSSMYMIHDGTRNLIEINESVIHHKNNHYYKFTCDFFHTAM